MNTPTPPPLSGPIEIRYGFVYCGICGLEVRYCRGHAQSDSGAAQDGAESQLRQRIAEVVAKRAQAGGR